MKSNQTKSSYWELLLGISIIAFQLCAWPTNQRQVKWLEHPRDHTTRRTAADIEGAQPGWEESATASELLSVSDLNLKTS